MRQGNKGTMGKSSIFSGSGSKQGLAAKIEKFNPSKSQDMVLSGKGPSKKEPKAKQSAGFNFMPPENKKSKSELIAGEGKQKDSYKKDYASYAYDPDQDGDSALNDYNQDGTMLGRGIKAVSSYLSGPKKTKTDAERRAALTGAEKKHLSDLKRRRGEQAAKNADMKNKYIQASK